MRAHPLRTPGRDHPGKHAPERLRHSARVESPAQSPGAPQTPQRSGAAPSPKRHPRTPTLHATRPEVTTASAPSNAKGPAPEQCQERNTPARFKPRPQPLGITRTNSGTVSGPSEKMRAHPLRTPGREHPGKPTPERLRQGARVESPAQSPGAPQTPQRSRPAPSPKRHPQNANASRHPARGCHSLSAIQRPKAPHVPTRHTLAPLHTAQGTARNPPKHRHGMPRHDSRPALSASASHAPTPGQSPTPQKKCARILSEHRNGTTPANPRQNA
jgi:hypothetical protein